MYEFAALTVGVALWVILYRLGPRVGAPVVGVGALATGLLVSGLSGELEMSWGFLVFDVGQVVVAALCGAALASAIAQRRGGDSSASRREAS